MRLLRYLLGLMAVLTLVFMLADWRYPLPDRPGKSSVIVLAKDGSPLRAFADQQGVWRFPVTLDEVSPLYLQALLGYEDRWFIIIILGSIRWHYCGLPGSGCVTGVSFRVAQP
ncbi:MAG: hypothetical protein R3E89_00945 [Thiolinea sp.]